MYAEKIFMKFDDVGRSFSSFRIKNGNETF